MNADNNPHTLWRSLTDGKPEALSAFYRRYRPLLMSIARRMVKDEWDAEEVTQDVLLIVHRKAHTVRSADQFEPWVKQVTRNAALMLIRKRKRRPTPMADEYVETFLERRAPRDVHTPDEFVAERRFAARLQRRLEELPAAHRDLYIAMDVRGVGATRAAAEFGLTSPALKSRLHRIRRSLREAAVAA